MGLLKKFKQYFSFIWYYIGWFGCVYLGKYGFSKWSLFFPLLLVTLLLIWRQLSLKMTGLLVCLAAPGMIFDALMAANGRIIFVSSNDGILPYWLISIWLLFLFVIPVMVPIFYPRLWVAAILGVVFGPLSYASGVGVGVLTFQGPLSVYCYAGFWGLYFPLSVYIVGTFLTGKNKSN